MNTDEFFSYDRMTNTSEKQKINQLVFTTGNLFIYNNYRNGINENEDAFTFSNCSVHRYFSTIYLLTPLISQSCLNLKSECNFFG